MKNDYKAEQNNIPCASCIAFAADGKQYVYSLAARQKKTVHMETEYEFSQEEMAMYRYAFGQTGWGRYTGKEKTMCTVMVGFDQPQDFNLPGMPVSTDDAFLCCNKCGSTSGTATWMSSRVWMEMVDVT